MQSLLLKLMMKSIYVSVYECYKTDDNFMIPLTNIFQISNLILQNDV